MTLADDIATYLQGAFRDRYDPFCFCIDSRYRLTDWWGNADRYGYSALKKGDDMLAEAPFLLNCLGDEPLVMPLVTLPKSGTVDIHIVPRAEDHAVILLGRRTDHSAAQARQQAANENRLLQVQQQKLIGRQRDLIAELVEARAQLEQQRVEAERANQAKGRYIAMMSHEFRTPLASIISHAYRMNAPDTDDETASESGKAISRAAGHLHDLVNSVLDEARLEAGHQSLRPAPVNLRGLLDDLNAIIAPLAGEKALSFVARLGSNVPERVMADDGCLRQVLLNLLGNAVKYTDDGAISIDIDWQNDEIQATVCDDGPGIAKADQERMFEAFQRGVSHDHSVQGTGLGLAICVRLTELMQGKLVMDSDIGRGCRITVTIPAVLAESISEDEQLSPPSESLQTTTPAVVLICDDDKDMRAIHEYYLTRAGYKLLVAADGPSALAMGLEQEPDLAVLDINTPGMSGIDVARELRAQGFDRPIIALTASDASRLDPGLFDERLRKPLQMPKLLSVLKASLQQ